MQVHRTGIPWNDKSGDNLRHWMGVDKTIFYDTDKIGIMPMGFCYPGKGKSGDLPPRPECAPLWHKSIISQLEKIELMVLIGQYAQHYYLKDRTKATLTETVLNYQEYQPQFFVLPHPSPRNNIWMAKNSWFAERVLPELKNNVATILRQTK
jgi:uracil-DNA glycosylase